MTFSLDETTDVGHETGTPVGDEYTVAESTFSGTIKWVRLDTGLDDHDQLITPEDRERVAMTRQ
jgi:arylsulfatase